MNKTILYLLPCFFALFAVACNPDDGPDPDKKNGETVCDYAPFTSNSIFSYETSGAGSLTTAYDIVVVGDTMIAGEAWKIVENRPGGRSYYNCRNGVHTSRSATVPAQILEPVFDFVGLRTGVPVGTRWTQNYRGQGGIIRYIHEIKEIDGTRTVNSMDFVDVIAVEQTTQQLVLFFGDTTVFTADVSTYWYAPDAFLIESDVADIKITSFDVK